MARAFLFFLGLLTVALAVQQRYPECDPDDEQCISNAQYRQQQQAEARAAWLAEQRTEDDEETQDDANAQIQNPCGMFYEDEDEEALAYGQKTKSAGREVKGKGKRAARKTKEVPKRKARQVKQGVKRQVPMEWDDQGEDIDIQDQPYQTQPNYQFQQPNFQDESDFQNEPDQMEPEDQEQEQEQQSGANIQRQQSSSQTASQQASSENIETLILGRKGKKAKEELRRREAIRQQLRQGSLQCCGDESMMMDEEMEPEYQDQDQDQESGASIQRQQSGSQSASQQASSENIETLILGRKGHKAKKELQRREATKRAVQANPLVTDTQAVGQKNDTAICVRQCMKDARRNCTTTCRQSGTDMRTCLQQCLTDAQANCEAQCQPQPAPAFPPEMDPLWGWYGGMYPGFGGYSWGYPGYGGYSYGWGYPGYYGYSWGTPMYGYGW